MKRETKTQIYTLIVLFLFVGSGLAYAVAYVLPLPKPAEGIYVFDVPLSDAQEGYFIEQNKVVMKYFYSPTCLACRDMESIIEEVIEHLKENLITEKINIKEYSEVMSWFDIKTTPSFILKGKTIERYEDMLTKDELLNKICALYFEEIDECTLS